MSLDPLELELLIKSGTPKQAARAKRIAPIRARGNQLLCTLVLTNTAIYSLLPIVISDLTDGLTGFLVSTVLSVLFGEIIPQSICARHGLAIGANTVWLVQVSHGCAVADRLAHLQAARLPARQGDCHCLLAQGAHSAHRLSHRGQARRWRRPQRRRVHHHSQRAPILHHPRRRRHDAAPKVYSVPIDAVLDERTMVSISKAGNSRVPVVDATRGARRRHSHHQDALPPLAQHARAGALHHQGDGPQSAAHRAEHTARRHAQHLSVGSQPHRRRAQAARPLHAAGARGRRQALHTPRRTRTRAARRWRSCATTTALRPLRAHDHHFSSFQPTGQMYQQGDADDYRSVDNDEPAEPFDPALVQRRRVRRRVRDKVVIIDDEESTQQQQ
jgi:hypothetical protein